jgi:hypothetical protein
MPHCIDAALFRRRLEKACEAALHDARTFPCEETLHRASGKLDGLLHGAAAALLSLRLDNEAAPLLEDTREIVGRFRKDLDGLTDS